MPWFRRGNSCDDGETAIAQQNLDKVQGMFNQMRVAVSQDLPALNEATRLVHEIDAAVVKMSNADTKAVWKTQVEELHRELQMVTARMLSIEIAAPAAPAAPAPAQPPEADSLFAGLDVGGGETPENNMFSGLDVGDSSMEVPVEQQHEVVHTPRHDVASPLPQPISTTPSTPPTTTSPPTSAATTSPLDLLLFGDSAVYEDAPLPDLTSAMSTPAKKTQPAAHLSPLSSLIDMLSPAVEDHPDSIPAPSHDDHDDPSILASPRHTADATSSPPHTESVISSNAASAAPEPPLVIDEPHPHPHPPTPTHPPPPPQDHLPTVDDILAHTTTQLAALDARIQAADTPLRAARARARTLSQRVRALEATIAEIHNRQVSAVQAEDFDNAAALSTQLEAHRGELKWVMQDVHVAEEAVDRAVVARGALVKERVGVLNKAVEDTEQAAERARVRVEEERAEHDKLLCELRDAAAAAKDHLVELQGRVQAKEKGMQEAREALQRKIDDSTAPLQEERTHAAHAVKTIQDEIATIQATLLAKQNELTQATASLHNIDARIATITAKYDKSKSMVQEDQAALEADSARMQVEATRWEKIQARVVEEECVQSRSREAVDKGMGETSAQLEVLKKDVQTAMEVAEQETARQTRIHNARAAKHKALRDLNQLIATRSGYQDELKSIAAQRRVCSTNARRAKDQIHTLTTTTLPELHKEKQAAAAAGDYAAAKRLTAEIQEGEGAVHKARDVVVREEDKVGKLEEEEREMVAKIEGMDVGVQEGHVKAATITWLEALEEDVAACWRAAQAAGRDEEAAEYEQELVLLREELGGREKGGGDEDGQEGPPEEEPTIVLPDELFGGMHVHDEVELVDGQ